MILSYTIVDFILDFWVPHWNNPQLEPLGVEPSDLGIQKSPFRIMYWGQYRPIPWLNRMWFESPVILSEWNWIPGDMLSVYGHSLLNWQHTQTNNRKSPFEFWGAPCDVGAAEARSNGQYQVELECKGLRWQANMASSRNVIGCFSRKVMTRKV